MLVYQSQNWDFNFWVRNLTHGVTGVKSATAKEIPEECSC
jgi:hypothetical protein